MKTLTLGLLLLVFTSSALAIDRVDLDNRIRTLTVKFENMQAMPDKRIPAAYLQRARGIILLDRTKAGFIFAYQGGGGVAMVRGPHSDAWSPVAFLSANQASLGFQIGGEQDFYVILLMTPDATRVLTEPKFEVGGEARGTAGDTSAAQGASIVSPDAPLLVYSDHEGLYGGAALKAGALTPDDQADQIYYGQFLSMNDILFGNQVKPTDAAADLGHQLAVQPK
jgi:lipid-binding SYLF domain-containing protein